MRISPSMSAEILTGNQAAARGAFLSKVEVISAYPITPQSPVVEELSVMVETGRLKAKFIPAESEHSAITICIAASSVGARTFTATSANGLALMHEQLHWAAGARLPIVMACVNRAIASPWSIWNDQQDSISQRDTGWIQIYCESNQEILDTIIMSFRLAEQVHIPVMVCYDGFLLSHTCMPVEAPESRKIKDFIPAYQCRSGLMVSRPANINAVVMPDRRRDAAGLLRSGYLEFRASLHHDLLEAKHAWRMVVTEYNERLNRNCSALFKEYRIEGAEYIIVTFGSLGMEAEDAVDRLRDENVRVGLISLRMYRPFPNEELFRAVRQSKGLFVFEKDISPGKEGALSSDLKACLFDNRYEGNVHNYIVGLGGRDFSFGDIIDIIKRDLPGKTNTCSFICA